MSKRSCKSTQLPERVPIWDPERELPRHLGYKLVPCKYCNRTFFANRVDYHQEICGATRLQTKPPVYDSVKSRITGTVAESYQNWSNSEEVKGPLNPYWRENREFFKSGISLLRDEQKSARTAGLALETRGRQLASLAHCIQCPICGRRFNEHAAARHIPHCTNYVSKKGNTTASPAASAPPSGSSSKLYRRKP